MPLHQSVDEAVPVPASALIDLYRTMLRNHGEPVNKIWRVLPPCDTGDPAEILYLGTGNVPFTAYVLDETDAPPPLICTGW